MRWLKSEPKNHDFRIEPMIRPELWVCLSLINQVGKCYMTWYVLYLCFYFGSNSNWVTFFYIYQMNLHSTNSNLLIVFLLFNCHTIHNAYIFLIFKEVDACYGHLQTWKAKIYELLLNLTEWEARDHSKIGLLSHSQKKLKKKKKLSGRRKGVASAAANLLFM